MNIFISKPGIAAGILVAIVLLTFGCESETQKVAEKGKVQAKTHVSAHVPDIATYKTIQQPAMLRVICPGGLPPIDLNLWYVTLNVGPNVIVTNNTIPPGSEIQILQIKRISDGSNYPPPMPTAAITDLPVTVLVIPQ